LVVVPAQEDTGMFFLPQHINQIHQLIPSKFTQMTRTVNIKEYNKNVTNKQVQILREKALDAFVILTFQYQSQGQCYACSFVRSLEDIRHIPGAARLCLF
jgi:hypothetical protein